MAANSFGNLFRITTWGESHGAAIGVVIDGCPPHVPFDQALVEERMQQRAPGGSSLTSPRQESDEVEVLSGVFEGVTTGAPISLLIRNQDARSKHYDNLKELMRPGHASFTYLEKYGLFDHRGGGRASARETAARVAAGAVASMVLRQVGIKTAAYIRSIGEVCWEGDFSPDQLGSIRESAVNCPDAAATERMIAHLTAIKEAGNSTGGVVEAQAWGVPAGLGDPVYDKVEARLAYAMLSIPGTKGFEIGEGFASTRSTGKENNDPFILQGEKVTTATNHSGGVLGGITTGSPLLCRVACKPTSTVFQEQQTVDRAGNSVSYSPAKGSRHDPCIAIRAVPVVEAMLSLVLVDVFLMQQHIALLKNPEEAYR